MSEDKEDNLAAAIGILNGLILSVLFWVWVFYR